MTISKMQLKKYNLLDGTMTVTRHKELFITHFVWDFESAKPSEHTLFVLSSLGKLTKDSCTSPAAKKLLADSGEHLAENLVVFAKGAARQVYIKDAAYVATPIVLMGEPKQYMLEGNLLKM